MVRRLREYGTSHNRAQTTQRDVRFHVCPLEWYLPRLFSGNLKIAAGHSGRKCHTGNVGRLFLAAQLALGLDGRYSLRYTFS